MTSIVCFLAGVSFAVAWADLTAVPQIVSVLFALLVLENYGTEIVPSVRELTERTKLNLKESRFLPER